jgi:hypothetical protein
VLRTRPLVAKLIPYRASFDRTLYLLYIFLILAHHEGVSGGVRRRSRMRRPRPVPRTHGSRAAPGTRPEALRPPATGSLTDGGGALRMQNRATDEKRGPGCRKASRRSAGRRPRAPNKPAANTEPVRLPALRPPRFAHGRSRARQRREGRSRKTRTSVRRENEEARPNKSTRQQR